MSSLTLARWTARRTRAYGVGTISKGSCPPRENPSLGCLCLETAVAPVMALFALLVLATFSLGTGCASAPASFQEQCTSFDPTSVGITNATVTEHAFIESGTNLSLPDNDPSCGSKSQVVPVDLCRVALQIATSGTSGVVAEIWLPESWNGRLVTTGNGGLGGCESALLAGKVSRHG